MSRRFFVLQAVLPPYVLRLRRNPPDPQEKIDASTYYGRRRVHVEGQVTHAFGRAHARDALSFVMMKLLEEPKLRTSAAWDSLLDIVVADVASTHRKRTRRREDRERLDSPPSGEDTDIAPGEAQDPRIAELAAIEAGGDIDLPARLRGEGRAESVSRKVLDALPSLTPRQRFLVLVHLSGSVAEILAQDLSRIDVALLQIQEHLSMRLPVEERQALLLERSRQLARLAQTKQMQKLLDEADAGRPVDAFGRPLLPAGDVEIPDMRRFYDDAGAEVRSVRAALGLLYTLPDRQRKTRHNPTSRQTRPLRRAPRSG